MLSIVTYTYMNIGIYNSFWKARARTKRAVLLKPQLHRLLFACDFFNCQQFSKIFRVAVADYPAIG